MRYFIKKIGNGFKKFFSYLNPQRIKFHSLQFEVSFLYTAILGIVLVVFSGVLYAMLFFTLYTEQDTALKFKAQKIVESINDYLEIKGQDPKEFMFAVDKTITSQGKHLSRWWILGFERQWYQKIEGMALEEDYINFVSSYKVSLVNSANLSPELLEVFLKNMVVGAPQPVFKNITFVGQHIRLINYPFVYLRKVYWVQVGVLQRPFTEAVLTWLHSIVISIPIALLLTSFVGYILARRILNPVQEITTIAKKITYEDLSTRVKTTYSYDEMKYLCEAFNDMISRLEKSFKHIEEFSYHVAHELKTPLTIIKGESQVTLMDKREPQEYEQTLKICLEEVDNMLRTIEDLLYLARLDYQPGIFKFKKIEFVKFLNEIYDHSKILGQNKKIKINFKPLDEKIMVNADTVHLRRLFLNLIDNALKFTPVAGQVDITMKADENTVSIFVRDTGKGIATDEIPKIFDRFYRCDETAIGNGLGLSIVQSIAKIHSGQVNVESVLGQGTIFSVTLPRLII